jgi:hypothetical protein
MAVGADDAGGGALVGEAGLQLPQRTLVMRTHDGHLVGHGLSLSHADAFTP